jgi:phospholipid/cholesterol/gamma-HCH transport system substrate-binding protein
MGRERQIFAKQVEFFTTFNDVKGLAIGAPVRLGGIPIGRVAHVGFAKDPSDFRVHVTLSVNEAFLDRIRTDLSVSIETAGLLGDRFVSITSGHSLDLLPPGSVLPANEVSDITQVMARAQTMVQNTTEISDRINKALEGLSPQSIANFSEAAKGVAVLLADIKNEKGFLNRLIYSEEDGGRLVKGVSKATQDVSDLIAEVKNGSGFLHGLIYSPKGEETISALSQAAARIGGATEEVNKLLTAAREGKGLIHDLVYTEVAPGEVTKRIADVLKELNQTVYNLKAASDALANGTGTLGALLVDPQLYDNLVEVTDGAKRSFLLRQAIRSSLKQ